MFFDLDIEKILVLAVIALIIFGPNQLPKFASQAGKALRDLRRIAENAKADLQRGLGPELGDFDITDLNPRSFVRKHLMEDVDQDGAGSANGDPGVLVGQVEADGVEADGAGGLSPGESPPYDSEAT